MLFSKFIARIWNDTKFLTDIEIGYFQNRSSIKMSTAAENGHNEIVYRVATPNDRDTILCFLRKHYYPEEPITNGNEPKKQDSADEEFSLSVIEDGASIIAVDSTKNDKIVGAIMAGPIEPDEAKHLQIEAKRCYENNNKKWSEILLLLGHLTECANVFERFNVDKSLHIHVMSVDTAYRGKSIGTNLMRKCLEVGKSLSYPLASADCTNVFSIKIAEKIGMECINVLAFSDYKDNTGKQLFQPPMPNTHIKTFTKVL